VTNTVVQQFEAHDVWSKLCDFDQALSRTADMLDITDDEMVSIHAALTNLVNYVDGVLRSTNPGLVSIARLDSIAGALSSSLSHVLAFEDADANGIFNAWQATDAILTYLAGLPTVKAPRNVSGLTKAIAGFERHLTQRAEAIDARSEEIQQHFDELQSRYDALVTEIGTQNGSLSKSLSNFEIRLNQEMDERAEAFDEQMTIWKEVDQRASTERSELADQVLRDLHSELSQAKALVEMTGEVAMTGHYQRNAKQQQSEADRMRDLTVRLGLGAVASAVLIAVVGLIFKDQLDAANFISHAGITIALTSLATFIGVQSHAHRKREEKYRALELELATIDPFLNSLDDTERQRNKGELAMRYIVGVNRDHGEFDQAAE
jgi:hypothetical protein